MAALLAVDLGVRAGFACWGDDGRLRWYRSQNFGAAARMAGSLANLRRHASRRAAADATKSRNRMGVVRAQTPFGPRKSGMPDSVLIPAPVNTTARLDARRRRRSSATSDARSMRRACPHAPRATSRRGRHRIAGGHNRAARGALGPLDRA